ncbi:DUF4157 domain-containing protein [Variovorax sp. LjRoot130]
MTAALAARTSGAERTQVGGKHRWLQRKCACGGSAGLTGHCSECERKKALGLQAKLAVGAAHDPLEEEADRVADQLTRPQLASPPRVQRASAPAASAQQSDTAPDSVDQVLASSGRALDAPLRQDFEQRFGHDFSRVRIHADEAAARSAQALGANAWTVGEHIAFAPGRFAPQSRGGRQLLAHELTHVVQQSATTPLVQCDLAIGPQVAAPTERPMSERDIEDAIRFNQRQFSDPYSLAVIRDVIGVSRFPAVSDRDLALGVARWQASHGLAQDGRLGAVTVTYVVEELQAEGNPGDAALLIADFPDRALLDITTAFCSCIPRLQSEIQDANFFIGEYTACGADPGNTTGAQVEACIEARAAAAGSSLVTAGTTDSSGTVRVAPVAGPCGPLEERLTLAHEQIHSVHTRELQQQHGRGTRAFRTAFNEAGDWVVDEINSRRTDIAVANWMIDVLNRACP